MPTRDDVGVHREIMNCGSGVRFEFQCPLTWLELEETGDERKRFCPTCTRHVFWCHDVNEAAIRADNGECIAVPIAIADRARLDAESGPRVILGQASTARHVLERAYHALVHEEQDEP